MISSDEFKELKKEDPELAMKYKVQTVKDWGKKVIKENGFVNTIWLSKANTEASVFQNSLMTKPHLICLPKGRIAYVDPITNQEMKAPSFNSIICFIPSFKVLDNPNVYFTKLSDMFESVFGTLGKCYIPT